MSGRRQHKGQKQGQSRFNPAVTMVGTTSAGTSPITIAASADPVTDYEAAVRDLISHLPSPSSESVLMTLLARDRVDRFRVASAELRAPEVVRLARLDGELRKAAIENDAVLSGGDLSAWKKSMDPASERWWWSLDEVAASARVKLLPSTALIVTIFLGISFAITGDTVGQLLRLAAVSAGVVAIAIQAALTFLTGSALTESGRKWALGMLSGMGLKKSFRDTKVIGLALTVFAISILARWLLPDAVARYYVGRGDAYRTQSAWSQAIESYNRALTLNPTDSDLHYKLAIAYDSSFQFERAIDEYKAIVATDNTNSSALNNLARLYIIQKTEDPALRLLDRVSGYLPSLRPDERYYVLKNRGWVKLGLQLYNESEDDLRAALLARDGAAARYLLGQVLEDLNRPAEAQKEFRRMIEIIAQQPDAESELEPDWIIRAQAKLLRGGGK